MTGKHSIFGRGKDSQVNSKDLQAVGTVETARDFGYRYTSEYGEEYVVWMGAHAQRGCCPLSQLPTDRVA